MAELLQLYPPKDQAPESQRAAAVSAALELIRADRLGGATKAPLSTLIDKLPEFADQIQEALQVGDPG